MCLLSGNPQYTNVLFNTKKFSTEGDMKFDRLGQVIARS